MHEDDGPRGTMRGLVSCASIWSCAVCSAHIRQARAEDIAEACRRHLEAGGGLAMVTLTLRHNAGEALDDLLSGLLAAWRATVGGSPWQRKRDGYGVVGFVRSVEVTWGEAHGWHPHLHVLLFLAAPLPVEDELVLGRWLCDRWRDMVTRRGLGEPDDEHGVRLQAVTAGEAAGLYVAKVQEDQERSVGLEMARGDLKGGRTDRWLPFGILEHAGLTGEAWALERWWEYEAATKGRRAIEWSRGLRGRLGMDDEQLDEAIVADDDTSAETLLVRFTADEWYAVVRCGLEEAVLEACEHPDGREAARVAVLQVLADAVRRDRALRRRRMGRGRDPGAG